MEEQFRVSSFRTKIYLGGCRRDCREYQSFLSESCATDDISSDEQPFVPFRANQFVIVSGESMGKFIAGTRLTANIRACVSVASSQSTAGLGEL